MHFLFKNTLILLHILSVSKIYTQYWTYPIPDSLHHQDVSELKQKLRGSFQDCDRVLLYSQALLTKSIEIRDTIHMLKSLYYMTMAYRKDKYTLTLSDTMIRWAEKLKNHKYVSLANLVKGDYYFDVFKLPQALNHYLTVKKYDSINSDRIKFIVNQDIAIIKGHLGKNKEALEITKESWDYVNKTNLKDKDPHNYLNILFSLSNNFRKVQAFDSAQFYNTLGVNESLENNNLKRHTMFMLNQAIVNLSLDSLEKSYNTIIKVHDSIHHLSRSNQLVTYYYTGELLKKQHNNKVALQNFRKVDSLFDFTNNLLPETRKAYEYLITNAKNNSDIDSQLYYISKLLKVDSILNSNYQYMSSKIFENYDTPKLIADKNKLISKLKKSEMKSNYKLFFTSTVVGILALFLFHSWNQKKILKQNLYKLKHDTKIVVKEGRTQNTPAYILKDERKNEILSQLDTFEKNHGFLISKLTLNQLAKSFGTNSSYLSKIINHEKNVTFRTYINMLRITYCINRVENDTLFKNYKTSIIAREIGFSSTEAFNKAFVKKTGLSYANYIKKL